MANWSLPTLTSTYTNFLTEVTGRDTDVALGLDPATTTVTNPPTNAIRWNSANNRWEKWNGTVWGTLSATYAFTAVTTTGNASVGGTLSVTGATALAAATATTPATGATGTEVATAAWVNAQGFAKLASPTLTGTPAAPTAAANTNTTQIATTAFVLGQAASATPLVNGTAAVGTGTTFARADHVHPTDTTRAPLVSPSFTGTASFAGDINMTGTGYLDLPVGTTAQRPVAPAAGMIRYNSTLNQFEGYGTAWGSIGGGATGGGSDRVFNENDQTVTTNYTITSGRNAVSAGPVTINTGITVTIPSGSDWAVV